MSIFKNIFIALTCIIAVPLIVAAFTSKDYSVEREVTVNQSKEKVFNYIRSLKNQEKFSKWATMDPHMDRTYSGTDGTVGFIAGWVSDSSDVGIGEQEIMAIKEGERIDFALRFKEPFESSDKAYMTTESISADQTKVKWGFDGHMGYPMNIMLLFMDMEETLGNDFQYGLDKLKANME